MKVVFVLRRDAESKPGGDVDLARKFVAALATTGVIAITASHADIPWQTVDACVLFNLDQPLEAYLVALECRKRNVAFFIYTLHHKGVFVEQYLRSGTRGIQRLIARVARWKPQRYETFMSLIRIARSGDLQAALNFRPMSVCARFLLAQARQRLVSCDEEVGFIEEDFGVTLLSWHVVPHVFAADAEISHDCSGRLQRKSSSVVCAGRIEPRKNQLEIIALAKDMPWMTFIFVGKKNLNHRAYSRAFTEAIKNGENLEWRDHVSGDELRNILSDSSVYCNASWFEVFSLIDLTALSLGCRCILSTGSYLGDFLTAKGLAGHVVFASPNATAIKGALEADVAGPASTEVLAALNEWSPKGVAGALIAALIR